MRELINSPSATNKERMLQKIDLLIGESRRLQAILDEFLDYARGSKIVKGKGSIVPVLSGLVELIKPEAEEKSIKVRTSFAPDLPDVEFDEGALKQAFINILANALQAMEDGGELMVVAAREPHSVRIDITDTGPGMPVDMLDRVFNVYFSTKKTGTGMGLPIARRIIEEHDGGISVVSETGHGTCFSIRLPVGQGAEA